MKDDIKALILTLIITGFIILMMIVAWNNRPKSKLDTQRNYSAYIDYKY